MNEDRIAFEKNYLLVGAPVEAVEALASLSTIEIHANGDVLIRQGEKNSDLLFILDGKVVIESKDGDRFGEAVAGAVLGEVSLVDDGPRSADVVCSGITRVARIPAKELRGYMNKHRDVGFIILANLSRVLSMRLRQANVKMDELMEKPKDPWMYAEMK